MAADDEIWRPTYDGPSPVSGDIAFSPIEDSPEPAGDGSCGTAAGREGPTARAGRRTWRRIAAPVAVATVAAAAFVVVSTVSDPGLRAGIDPTVVDPRPASADAGIVVPPVGQGDPLRLVTDPSAPVRVAGVKRLPAQVTPLWSIELPPMVADGGANSSTWVEVVGDRDVVVGTGDLRSAAGPASVWVLDARTGERRWVTQLEARIDQVEFVAAVDDVLVLQVSSEVLAFDLQDGTTSWTLKLFEIDGVRQQIRPLPGTDLLVRSGPAGTSRRELIDVASGALVTRWTGELLDGDGSGGVRALMGGKVIEYGAEDGWQGGELVATLDPELTDDVAIVGDSLVATNGGRLAAGSLADADGTRRSDGDGLTPLEFDATSFAQPFLARSVVPLGGSGMAVVGGGTIRGAEVVDGDVRFAWERGGALTAVLSTERGALLLVGTEGGGVQTLVDAASGATVLPLTMAPGFLDALAVVDNGIVTRRTSAAGARLAAFDLDGNELWALEGAEPVSVGDGLVVRSIADADGTYGVDAYGDES